MTTISKVEQMSLDEYVRLYEQEGAFEIIDGEHRPLLPQVALHGLIAQALFIQLDTHCRQNQLGEVFNNMLVVQMVDDKIANSYRPDVLFIKRHRWQEYKVSFPNWLDLPFIIVPDFVIEVVSPNDLYTELQQKVEVYQHDGVRLIWIVDPMRKKVVVYSGEQFFSLGAEDTLSGGDVLPDLQINLKDLFGAIDSEGK